VRDQVLTLDLLRWAHELRAPSDVEVPPKSAKGGGVSEAEIKMAQQLIDGMTGTWDPERFKDEYRDDVMALVRKKVKSGQIHTIVEPEPYEEARRARPEVRDLMPLLKQSLAARGAQGRRPAKAKRPAASKPKSRRRSA
jgi:DNA end-binding protein Ku